MHAAHAFGLQPLTLLPCPDGRKRGADAMPPRGGAPVGGDAKRPSHGGGGGGGQQGDTSQVCPSGALTFCPAWTLLLVTSATTRPRGLG
jgi:hypothetical protein